jgi:Protein of unknown function (DUF2721)
MIDRARVLAKELHTAPPAEAANLRAQIAILFRRARWMRVGLAAGLVIVLFTTELFDKQWVQLISLHFVGALLCLIGAVLAFLYDIHLSLVALKLELGDKFSEVL